MDDGNNNDFNNKINTIYRYFTYNNNNNNTYKRNINSRSHKNQFFERVKQANGQELNNNNKKIVFFLSHYKSETDRCCWHLKNSLFSSTWMDGWISWLTWLDGWMDGCVHDC